MRHIEIMFVGNDGELHYIYLADTHCSLALVRFREKCNLPIVRVIERPLIMRGIE
jgi:hypothetical protein